MEFFKRYAYVILGVVCVLALGGLFMATRSRPSGVIDAGQPLGQQAYIYEVIANPLPTYTQPPDDTTAQQPEPTSSPKPTTVIVHIVGAVHNPGVFEVPSNARINYVLQLAGGKTDDADHDQMINLAATVQDEMQIRIPAIGDEPREFVTANQPVQESQQANQGQAAVSGDGLVNINFASLAELQTLPNIGPIIAQNIIDFREANDGFGSVDELINVSRIGAATLDRIRDMVTVE